MNETEDEAVVDTQHAKPDRGGPENICREAAHVAAVATAIMEKAMLLDAGRTD